MLPTLLDLMTPRDPGYGDRLGSLFFLTLPLFLTLPVLANCYFHYRACKADGNPFFSTVPNDLVILLPWVVSFFFWISWGIFLAAAFNYVASGGLLPWGLLAPRGA